LSLKSRAGWDLAANAVGYGGIAFAIGWGTTAPLATAPLAAAALPWVLAVGAVFAATTVVDEPGDRSAGAQTLAVALGPPRTRAVACALLLLSIASSVATRATASLALAAASLPFMLLAWRGPSRRSDHLAFQVAAGLPALTAAWLAPLFGAALVSTALATRAYYRVRFGWGYPHLGAPARAQSFGLRTTFEDSPGSTR
jgi:1,4-dihydroxy-2-naphthoate octaprenyltransferase